MIIVLGAEELRVVTPIGCRGVGPIRVKNVQWRTDI